MLINVSNDYADSSIYFGLDYVMILYAFWKSTRVLGISKGERASMIYGRGMFLPFTKEALSFTNAYYSLVNFQTSNKMMSSPSIFA